jgi:hypothetical protein
MTNADWEQLTEVYLTHRTLTDADVVATMHAAQEWAEIDRLIGEGRLPTS